MAGLRTPGREGGHLAGSTSRLWPVCARQGTPEDYMNGGGVFRQV